MSDINFYGIIPTRATQYSAGYDLRSNTDVTIPPGSTVAVDTGMHLIVPSHVFAMVCSRSGLALRGLVVANAPGIIDADYPDAIQVLLHNRTASPWIIEKGQRIAQLVFVPYCTGGDVPMDQRVGGLGSTGE